MPSPSEPTRESLRELARRAKEIADRQVGESSDLGAITLEAFRRKTDEDEAALAKRESDRQALRRD